MKRNGEHIESDVDDVRDGGGILKPVIHVGQGVEVAQRLNNSAERLDEVAMEFAETRETSLQARAVRARNTSALRTNLAARLIVLVTPPDPATAVPNLVPPDWK